MKFKVTVAYLKNVLDMVNSAIPKTSSLPMFTTAFFHKDGEDIKLIGGDSDRQLFIVLDQLMDMEGDWKDFCLSLDQLTAAISKMPEQPLDITIDEGLFTVSYVLSSKEGAKRDSFSIPIQDSEQYVLMQGKNFDLEITVPPNELLPFVKTATNYTSTKDAAILRPVMACVALDCKEDMLVFAASDGHRLYRNRCKMEPSYIVSGEAGMILIHREHVPVLLKAFCYTEEITIDVSENALKFTSEDGKVAMLCVGISGKFPNYNSVIPTNNPHVMIADKKEMLRALNMVSLFASESSKQVAIRKDGMVVTLEARDIDFSLNGSASIFPTECSLPDKFAIGFNSDSLRMVLSDIPTEQVKFELSDPSRAGVLHPDDENIDLTLLIMPLILND